MQNLAHFVIEFFGGDTRKLTVIVEKFVSRQIVVEVGLLGKKSDLRFHRRIVDFPAQDSRTAAGRIHQAHEQLECRGFAGAVWSEIAKNLAFFDRQMKWAQACLGFFRQKPTL